MKHQFSARLITSLLGIAMLTGFAVAETGVPDLRDQISLNGKWNFTPKGGTKTSIPVPEYWDARPGFKCSEATYERSVLIPVNWAGKRIKVEFDGVFFVADVYVDGTYVGNHVGAWVPFAFDITEHAKPGQTIQLKVVVKGGSQYPIIDDAGKITWPVGWYGHVQHWGIAFDVWLRAYGVVHIEDTYVMTSTRQKKLTVQYKIKNSDKKAHDVDLNFQVMLNGISKLNGSTDTVKLEPGQTKTVFVSKIWNNASYWSPETPVLYHLVSTLKSGQIEVDQETRRFGFREIYIVGNQYFLNGSRLNLYGSSINWHGQEYDRGRYTYIDKNTWRDTIRTYQSINVNMMRLHQEPAARFVYEIADEEGFLLIPESAVYGRRYLAKHYEPYVKNSVQWTGEWIRSLRNHPSIILWSTCNEVVYHFYKLTQMQGVQLVDAISAEDNTRPITNGGDRDVGGKLRTLNLHYPEGYAYSYRAPSIYSWANKVKSDKPTGIGEFLTSYDGPKRAFGEENRWWHGTVIRGLRYTNFTDVRPYTLQYVLKDYKNRLDDPIIQNIKRGWAPVALFDKNYDDLGLAPVKDKVYPTVHEGAELTRTLVLYNDEFSNTDVKVEVEVKVGADTFAKGSGVYKLPLGEHRDIICSFQAPFKGGQQMNMILRAYKDGFLKFEDDRFFKLMDAGIEGTSSDTVILTEPPDPPK